MSARVRKLVGLLGIVVFLVVYAAGMAKLSDFVPQGGPWQLIYFLLAGTLWGVPILPLISWMNRGR
jgi:hypothetical protein